MAWHARGTVLHVLLCWRADQHHLSASCLHAQRIQTAARQILLVLPLPEPQLQLLPAPCFSSTMPVCMTSLEPSSRLLHSRATTRQLSKRVKTCSLYQCNTPMPVGGVLRSQFSMGRALNSISINLPLFMSITNTARLVFTDSWLLKLQ